MIDYRDYEIQLIEDEILMTYNGDGRYKRRNYTDFGVLLSLRKEMINRKVLAHQEDILPDIIAFNDALTAALREMYDRAYRIWNAMEDKDSYGDKMALTAKCYLGSYPKLHPIQGEEQEELWYAICDSGWNPLYEEGITLPTLRLPNFDESYDSFDSLIGMDCPPPNWNEGLDRKLTKDLHLTSAFHNIFEHMGFAITDFIYVREFKTEINIEINKTITH